MTCVMPHPIPTCRPWLTALLVATTCLLRLVAQAESAAPLASPLDEAATKALVARYQAAEHWGPKAATLLALQDWWHPSGVAMVQSALKGNRKHLHAFAIEALLRCRDELAPMLASKELLDELIGKQLRRRNTCKHYAVRVEAALQRLVPTAAVSGPSSWARWWQKNAATHRPPAWRAMPRRQGQQPDSPAGVREAFLDRLAELQTRGVDLMICLDSTRGMQPTIDVLAASIGAAHDALSGLFPGMRLGIVHYKERGELGRSGANSLQRFANKVRPASKQLAKLRASGGGMRIRDAMLGGLEVALDKSSKWRRNVEKLVLIIGDSPPYAADMPELLRLTRMARNRPERHENGGKPVTGKRKPTRPYRVATMAVAPRFATTGSIPHGYGQIHERMVACLTALATAGGGDFVRFEYPSDLGVGSSKADRDGTAQTDKNFKEARRSMVEKLLVLSVGAEFTREVKQFHGVLFAYREAGMFD